MNARARSAAFVLVLSAFATRASGEPHPMQVAGPSSRFQVLGTAQGPLHHVPPGSPGHCTVSSTSLSFGQYNIHSPTHLDSTGSISYSCMGGTSNVTILLSSGSGPFASRTMTFGGSQLQYNVYLDAIRATVWGDGSHGTSAYGPVQATGAVSIPVFGRVFAGQRHVAVGAYSDTLTATVLF